MRNFETDRRLYFSPFGKDEIVRLPVGVPMDEAAVEKYLQVTGPAARAAAAQMKYRKAVRLAAQQARTHARLKAREKQNLILQRAKKERRAKLTERERVAIEALNQQIADLSSY